MTPMKATYDKRIRGENLCLNLRDVTNHHFMYLFNAFGVLPDRLPDFLVDLLFILLRGKLDQEIACVHPRRVDGSINNLANV
jgi:hypothetical protein